MGEQVGAGIKNKKVLDKTVNMYLENFIQISD